MVPKQPCSGYLYLDRQKYKFGYRYMITYILNLSQESLNYAYEPNLAYCFVVVIVIVVLFR